MSPGLVQPITNGSLQQSCLRLETRGSRAVRWFLGILQDMNKPAVLLRLPLPKPLPASLVAACTVTLSRMPLPLLPTRVTCGFPSPADDFYGHGDDLDLNERVITNPPATFFVEADTGTSMVDFGIFPGDTLVVDRSLTAKHGDIVMVLWQGGYMIKQWCPTAGGLELRSGNGNTAAIQVGQEDELEVWGVVTWSFRKQFRR